ncbi:YbdK family carboxylate-amine ligase [Chitinimonas koreensis]|nr:YbdK family carboxylate-amine ligase [Chitinimonas koreensis]QNM94797.1 glutamate--cysteine ligase [Chitinimonas koreensis]
MGVELELQILSSHDYNLTRGAPDLLEQLARRDHPGNVVPEITEAMIELNSTVHHRYEELAAELETLRDHLVAAADRLHLALAGGGTHPFQRWSDQRIYPKARYLAVSELYGYLAKQFTVFGQHIHIACRDGDEAVRLTRLLSRYIPHFIALSASSPFYQGVDTAFDSSRLSAVNAFPLSGTMPPVDDWAGFRDYFQRMAGYGVVRSMKDFYWDIRPKPNYGTIELRICDTPLTPRQAARLAAFAQALVAWLRSEPGIVPHPDLGMPYTFNRFQACRFGLAAQFIDVAGSRERPLCDDLTDTLERVLPHSVPLGGAQAIHELLQQVRRMENDAGWLRATAAREPSLGHLMLRQAERWANG